MLTRAGNAVMNLKVNDVTDKGRSFQGRMQASRPLLKKPQGSRRLFVCSRTRYLRADKNQFDDDSLDMRSLACTFGGSRPGRSLDVRRWRHVFCKKTAKAAPLGLWLPLRHLLQVSPSAPS